MSNDSKFDASAQAVGYLHQVRSALLLAVRHDESADLLSLEVLDDVAFAPCDGDSASAVAVLQHKHTLSRSATLTDKSVDVWKTLRVWAELIHSKRIDPQRTVFSLVATATATAGSAIALLRREDRNPENARQRIEAAGAESTNKTVETALAALNKLAVNERKTMFGNMYLLDNAPNILHTRKLIEHELRFSVDDSSTQLKGFADRLEGWWFRTAVEHLSDTSSNGILVSDVQRHIRDLLDQFKRDNLPDDLLDAIIPKDKLAADDDRRFVLELRRITSNRNVVRLAQDNHYRAFEQRSKWVRETLLGISEEDAYEMRLLREWATKASLALDGFEALSTDEKVALGIRIYEWSQEASASSPTFFIRQRFVSGYLARGSLHMLVDKKRLYWHPDDAAGLLDKLLETADNA